MGKPLLVFFIASLLLFAFSRPHLATNVSFHADELMEVHLGARVARGVTPFSQSWTYVKTPGMSYLMALPSLLFSDGVSVLLTARLLFIPIALLQLLGLFYVAKEYGNKRAACLAVLALCCCTTFFDRSMRLRTDLVSTTLWCWALLFMVCRRKKGDFVKGGFLLGISFLFTQKAVYFVVAGFLLALLPAKKERWRAFFEYSLGSLLPLLVYFGYFALLGLAASCFKTTFAATKRGVSEFYRTWRYGIVEFWRSPFFWLFALVGVWRELKKGFDDKRKALFVASVTILVFTIIHPDKWPYFYLMLLPTTALFTAFALEPLAAWLQSKCGQLRGELWLIAILFVSLLVPLGYRLAEHLKPGPLMDLQLATIEWVEEITEAKDYFFDGVGMVPTRPRVYRELMVRDLILYRKGELPNIIEAMKKRACKVVIFNYRLNNLPLEEKKWIESHFLRDWGNVFVAGAKIALPNEGGGKFHLHCAGHYDISGPPGHVTINGKKTSVGSKVFLDVGEHTLSGQPKGAYTLRYRGEGKKAPNFKGRTVQRILARFEE